MKKDIIVKHESYEPDALYTSTFENISDKLKGKKDSFGKLMKDIILSGVCTKCAACAAVCPVLEWDELAEQPKLIGKCTACGICYNQCPRTITDPVKLIGEIHRDYVVSSNIDEVHGQDGGAITSILCYLFDEHLIDAAIVTIKDPKNPWYPKAKIATSKEEVIKGSGSIYVHSQTVEALMKAVRQGFRSIAFVGTPCNIDAVDKMIKSPAGLLHSFMFPYIFKIGLFCMDSFSPVTLYRKFERNGIDLKRVSKMDIDKGKFYIYYENTQEPVKTYSVNSLQKYKASSCSFCTDLAAENADISVGSVGSGPGKNTVLARSKIAVEIIEDAAKKGYIEIDKISSVKLNPLLNLARLKKVSKYNIQKRKVFIVRDVIDEQPAKLSKIQEQPETAKLSLSPTKKLKIVKKLNEEQKTLDLTITNSMGFTLDNVQLKVNAIEDDKEKNSWTTLIREFLPYEVIQIEYPINTLDCTVEVEAITDDYGKILSRSFFLPADSFLLP